MAYNDLIKDTNIIRSMSMAGKPTDPLGPVLFLIDASFDDEIGLARLK